MMKRPEYPLFVFFSIEHPDCPYGPTALVGLVEELATAEGSACCQQCGARVSMPAEDMPRLRAALAESRAENGGYRVMVADLAAWEEEERR